MMKKWMLIVAVVMVFTGYGHAEEVSEHSQGNDQPVVTSSQEQARPTVDMSKLEQEIQKAISACSEDRPQS